MFRISKRLDYGLKLMVALAEGNDNRPLATSVLAERLQMPLPFLHQIGHTLMQSGFIKASPGPRGGLRLSRNANMIAVIDIVEALEGPLNLSPETEMDDEATNKVNGTLRFVWANLQEKIIEYLAGLSLEDLRKTSVAVRASYQSVPQLVGEPNIEI